LQQHPVPELGEPLGRRHARGLGADHLRPEGDRAGETGGQCEQEPEPPPLRRLIGLVRLRERVGPADGGDGLDHVVVADRERLPAVGGHRIDHRRPVAPDRLHAGERPVPERRLRHVGQHKRRVLEADHDLARRGAGAFAPLPEGFEPDVSLERGHGLIASRGASALP
jgi:hypothetical protein